MDNFTTKIFKIIRVYLTENINTWFVLGVGLLR
jgi:hypothetical protein